MTEDSFHLSPEFRERLRALSDREDDFPVSIYEPPSRLSAWFWFFILCLIGAAVFAAGLAVRPTPAHSAALCQVSLTLGCTGHPSYWSRDESMVRELYENDQWTI
jgi:hypothetical protein